MLLTHIPTIVQEHTKLPPEDYPQVKFWFWKAWTTLVKQHVLKINAPHKELDVQGEPDIQEELNALDVLEEQDNNEGRLLSPAPNNKCGKCCTAKGIKVTMKYIQHEGGTVIDGYWVADICHFARSLWVQLVVEGKLFMSWSKVDAASLKFYYLGMAERIGSVIQTRK